MHLLHYLLIFVNVNENTVDHCLVMLVHSALTNVKQLYYFINALVNAEINIKISKCCRSIVHSLFMFTNEPYCKVLPKIILHKISSFKSNFRKHIYIIINFEWCQK